MATIALTLVEYEQGLAARAERLKTEMLDLAGYLADGMPEHQMEAEVSNLGQRLTDLAKLVRNALDDRDHLDRAWAADTRDRLELDE